MCDLNSFKKFKSLWLSTGAVMLTLLLQSCAGAGTLGSSGNSRTYQMDYDKMVETVEQAVRGVDLVIANSNESEDPQGVNITYAKVESVGTQNVQRHQGKIRVTRIDESKTEITIENPNYHFATSDRDRINYRRRIFDRIDDILD